MTTPQPLDEEELAGLVALLDADHHHDHEGAHGAGEAHDHHSRFALTVTGVRRRAAHLMRVEATIDDPDFDRWCLPNVAIRLELPVQPPPSWPGSHPLRARPRACTPSPRPIPPGGA